jgi:hypothetical protein
MPSKNLYSQCVLFIDVFHTVAGHFNPRLFNPGLFNPRPFNHEFFNHEFSNQSVEKFMVEKSGVEVEAGMVSQRATPDS